MASTKANCWEHMKCGREPGGSRVSDLGLCPVAAGRHSDETDSGLNGGRLCYAVAGTFSDGEPQGTFAKEFGSCMQCDFYKNI